MKTLAAQKFYDLLSEDYDAMINFDSSLEKRIELLRNYLLPGDVSAADLGCGSGLDSISLTKLGLNVTGFDISEKMIQKAAANSAKHNAVIKYFSLAINKIPNQFHNKFSVAVSLGNSLANINKPQLKKSFQKIYKMLGGEGRLILQILNYDKILLLKERIVNITENGDYYFVRFYDFESRELIFNILKFSKTESKNRMLNSSIIYPYKKKEIIELLKECGFGKIKVYGGLDKSKYDRKLSADLVIEAGK